MKRAKVHEVSSPISLFPFIGILLCTMGALLVILVAVSRSAKESAQVEVEAAREAGAHANQEDAAQLEQVSKYAADLHVVRTNGQNKLREEQARLSHLEDHIRRLREKIRSLQAAAVELKALEQEHYDDRGQAERELAKLQRLAAELQQSNAALHDEVAKGKRSYALVPYEGPNGTFRRPIYVECLEHELVLQPEGVVITADDLRPPFGAGNALASALRAARDYLIRIHPGEGASRDTEPYPLLLVRPEGLHSYDRARRAIEAGDFDFGFELIESDWDLKYPAADYKLAELESSAIEQARVRQQVLAEAAPRAYRNPSLAAAGQFEYEDEQLASAPNGRNMYVVRRKEPRGGTGLGGRGTEEGRYGGGFSGEGAGAGEGSGGGAGGDGGTDNGTAGGAPGSGETGSGGGGTGGYGVEGSAGGGGHGHGAGGGVEAGVAGGGYPGGPANSGSSVPGNASQASNSGSSTYTAAAAAGQSIGSSAGSFNSAFGSEPPDNDRGAAPRRTDFADAQQAQPGMYQDPGPSRHTPAQKPDEHDPHSKNDQDLSASRGQDWALRNKPGRAVPVRRTIRVVVRHNQLAILTDDRQQQSVPPAGKTIPLPGDTVQSLDAFVAEVRKLIDDWGIAGENLYWRPVLVLSVAPDGQQRAADLARLLKNSGLELSTGEVANHTSQGNPR